MRGVIPVGSTSLGRYIRNRVATVPGKWFESNRNKETMPPSKPIQVTNGERKAPPYREGNPKYKQSHGEREREGGRNAQKGTKIYV